ncbi:MAG: MBL fold metallo-hydrolase [Minisyncoccia bacterium]|jgi:L-ascorbate metabolism protein UlaG (beta-lactamase superfamily)
MVITYLGGECFKITQGDLTLAFNPPSKDSSLKTPKFGADIALVSMDHEDFNGVENAAFGEREPFVISGPGEYEVKGVAVRGFASESTYGLPAQAGGEKGINTIYSVALEGMNLCFLGALGTNDLPTSAKAELDGIDILFLPIGGRGMLDYDKAYALAVQLEPKAVIPMHYSASDLKNFLKEAGKEVEAQDKLTVKKKDLEGKEGEIIVLSA